VTAIINHKSALWSLSNKQQKIFDWNVYRRSSSPLYSWLKHSHVRYLWEQHSMSFKKDTSLLHCSIFSAFRPTANKRTDKCRSVKFTINTEIFTYIHTYTQRFIGYFPGKPGLAVCLLDSLFTQSPVILVLSVLIAQAKTIQSCVLK